MKRIFSLALAGVLVVGATACGNGDDDDDDNTVLVAPAEKEGGGAGNFACVGTADPFVGGVGSITLPLVVAEPLATGGEDPVEGATVVQIDADDIGTEIGTASAATDANGETSIDVDGNIRAAFALEGPGGGGYIKTYYFNEITPPDGTSPSDLLLISDTVYGAFIGLLGFQPADLAGTGQVSGAVADCDGDSIKNAVITVDGATPTFIGYFNESGTPDKNATETASNGQFLLVGVPPTTSTFHIQAWVYTGTEAQGEPTEMVAEAYAQAGADEISIAIVSPAFQ